MALVSSIAFLTATRPVRLRRLAADTIGGWAMDAVQKAHFGHPGMPTGVAEGMCGKEQVRE
jgi:hypothetical protein